MTAPSAKVAIATAKLQSSALSAGSAFSAAIGMRHCLQLWMQADASTDVLSTLRRSPGRIDGRSVLSR
jgi:hypothetical protein